MNPDRNLGQFLRALREARGWSLEDAAEQIPGVAPWTLGRWERGDRPCPITHWPRLCRAYHTTATDIVRAAFGDPATQRQEDDDMRIKRHIPIAPESITYNALVKELQERYPHADKDKVREKIKGKLRAWVQSGAVLTEGTGAAAKLSLPAQKQASDAA